MKRHMIMAAVSLMLLTAVFAAGCTSSTSPSNQTTTGNATTTTNVTANVTAYVTNGTPVIAPLGQTFTITLDANPSTGFQWEVEANANLTLVDNTYVPTEPVIPGSGGSDVFTFQGLTAGATILAFDHVSPAGTVTDKMLYSVTITP